MNRAKVVVDFFQTNLPELGLTRELLSNPDPELVKRLYAALLVYNNICSEDQLLSEAGYGLDEEYSAMAIVKHILNDLILPDFGRTVALLQCLVNFNYARAEFQNRIQEIFVERDERRHRQNQARVDLDSVIDKHKQRSCYLDSMRQKKAALSKDYNNLKIEDNTLRSEINHLNTDIATKEVQAAQETKCRDSEAERVRVQAEDVEAWRGKVIQSPDRQKAEMARQEMDLRELKEHSQNLEYGIDRCEKGLGMLEQSQRHLQSFVLNAANVQQKFSHLAEMRIKFSDEQVGLTELRDKRNELQREFDRKNAEYESAVANHNTKQQRIVDELQHLDGLVQSCSSDMMRVTDEIQTMKSENERIKFELKNKVAADIEKQLQDIRDEFEQRKRQGEEEIQKEAEVIRILAEQTMALQEKADQCAATAADRVKETVALRDLIQNKRNDFIEDAENHGFLLKFN